MNHSTLISVGRTIMGILSGNPQNEPMHYGEVFGVWTFIATTKAALAKYQTLLNHTGDKDLRKFIEDMNQNMKQEIEQTENVLKVNGIALPPSPPERPIANIESIPVGARFNDPEIAASISKDIAVGLVACSQIMGESIREDIGMMFAQLHSTKAQYAAKLLRINKEKGWLIPPPLHMEVPELAHV